MTKAIIKQSGNKTKMEAYRQKIDELAGGPSFYNFRFSIEKEADFHSSDVIYIVTAETEIDADESTIKNAISGFILDSLI